MKITLYQSKEFCQLFQNKEGALCSIISVILQKSKKLIYNHQMQNQTQIVFPIVYGSIAFSMGKKAQNNSSNTHKWICYVRGVNNEDLTYLIRKVDFILHSSFEDPIKPVDKVPFEIKKQGWGEFEIMIKIYFQHPTIPPVEIPHFLKLHHTHATGAQAAKKPLCSETYDQIVFTQMDEHIEKMLKGKQSATRVQSSVDGQMINEEPETVNPQQPLKSIGNYQKYLTDIKPDDHRAKLNDALNYIMFEIKSSEDKLRNADSELQKVYDEIYSNLP